MQITVFTSNQPRHLSLIESLSEVADTVYAIQECTTVFPGEIDDFFKKSPVMQDYFSRVIAAEKEVFKPLRFLGENVHQLVLKMGDLNKIPPATLEQALKSDLIIVFGASYIKDPLISALLKRRAVNIHMGISPYYRGSSCNFWAQYDGNHHLMGATLHMLSKGLDSGDILYTVFPEARAVDPFVYGMMCVKAVHTLLMKEIASGEILNIKPQAQDKSLEIRYTRNTDFNDVVASEFLQGRILDGKSLLKALQTLRPSLIRPQYVPV